MADWSSEQYLKFGEQRTRPARDLAACIRHSAPKSAVDIGCGPGNSTSILREFFPDADLLGIDSSANMIERAKMEHPEIPFRVCDARSLSGRYDLLFSNACLQWIPDHFSLIPFLMDNLNDNGVLAVQIPMNGEEPLFKLIREIAQEPEWGLRDVPLQPNETLTPQEYINILAGCTSSFDAWETKYYHRLQDHRALVEWVKGTRIRPYLEHLSAAKGAAFENEILHRVQELYSVMENGEVVLGFRRFFFVAVK